MGFDPPEKNTFRSLCLGQIPEEEVNVAKKPKMHTEHDLNGRRSPVYLVGKRKKVKSSSPTTIRSKCRLVCNHCKSRFPIARRLEFHMIRHHPDQIFLCYKPIQQTESLFADLCREIFKKETIGYNPNSKTTVPRQCSYCAKFSQYKQDYLRHLVYSHKNIIGQKIKRIANGESQIGFDVTLPGNQQCPVLDGSSLMEGQMTVDLEQRESESSRFASNHFDNRFPRADNLIVHTPLHKIGAMQKSQQIKEEAESIRKYFETTMVPVIDNPLICQVCGKRTKNASILRQHMQAIHLHHPAVKTYRCAKPNCTYVTASFYSYRRHWRDALSDNYNVRCPKLSKEDKKKIELTCQKCKKIFCKAYNQRRHAKKCNPS